jgi:hypothetical protein
MAAYSAGRSYSAIGDYFRRMRARLGAPKAITATAHKLARIIYHLLKPAPLTTTPSSPATKPSINNAAKPMFANKPVKWASPSLPCLRKFLRSPLFGKRH